MHLNNVKETDIRRNARWLLRLTALADLGRNFNTMPTNTVENDAMWGKAA